MTSFSRALARFVAPVGLIIGLTSQAFASDWVIDPNHSRVQFSVRHMMVSNVHGMFTRYAGAIMLDDKDITKSTVTVEIDASSINTDNGKRDEHLRSEDFFDVAKYPKISFHSTKVEKKGNGLAVTGDLTMHGVTKPVVLQVGTVSPEIKGMDGVPRRGMPAKTKLSRKDFGLKWNKALEAGGAVVGDEITIDLDVEAVKKG